MSAAKRVRTLGTVLLVVGLLAAAIVFSRALPDEELGIPGVDVLTKRDMLQLEKMGGKSYILFNDFNEWFASLWHGRRLAYTIGVLSVGGFLGCRWFADLLDHAPASDDD
ncbi:MAG: hypothetical protein WAN04_14210 [Candidatus Udaeobacter sp.]